MAKATRTTRKLTHVQLANSAFEIYVSRGGEHGHDVINLSGNSIPVSHFLWKFSHGTP
jgi:hypothetical protein